MREILRCDEPMRAHLLRGFLESHGIPAEVVGDQPFWADGSLVPRDMRPTLRVPDAYAERARELLAQCERRLAAGDGWQCSHCGERLAPQFDACWHCGEARPRHPGGG